MTRNPLEEIPGVGPKMARVLHDLGVRCVDDLKGQDPEALYDRLTALRRRPIDRCVLYVFRCAVYYAEDGRQPRKLKWWHWKDSVADRSIRTSRPRKV